MAKCSKCGRAISGFSFGRQKSVCKWCVQHEKAQKGELPDDDIQPVMANPWDRPATDTVFFTQLFILMNVLVYVGMCIAGVSPFDPTSQQLIHWGANYGPYSLGGQPWRLITSVFVHIGIIHIALNMWCLWSLGEMAEKLYGHLTFLIVYLTTGVAASLTSVWWRPVGVSAGASGAIFGVAGALIASYYIGEFSLPRDVVKASLRSVVTFAGYNLVYGAMSGRTDNAAHIGGLVSGLLIGAAVAKLAPDADRSTNRTFVAILGIALVTGSFFWLQRAKASEVLVGGGEIAAAEGAWEEAISHLERAVKLRPNDTHARLALSRAYSGNKQADKAREVVETGLALDPNNEHLRYELGVVYLDAKDIRKARDTFAGMLSLNPKSAYGHYGAGLVAYNENDPQSLIAEFSRAVELDPEFTSTYYYIGVAQTKLQKYEEAIATLQKAQRLAGDDPDVEEALANVYSAKGMTEQAQQAKEKAAKLKAEESSDEQ